MQENTPISGGDVRVNSHQYITEDKLKEFMPKGCNAKVTDSILATLNGVESATGISQNYFEEKFMGSMFLLGTRGVTIEKIINAVKYVCLKNSFKNNKKAWAITFPDRYHQLKQEGKFIDNRVSDFNGSDLVIEIEKKMLLPIHVTYSPYFHQSVERQINLMNGSDANGNPVSAHVQHLAASKLMDLLKVPEDNSIEIKVGQSDAAIAQASQTNRNLAEVIKNQKIMLAAGLDISQVQKIHVKKTSSEEEVIDAETE